ncbi:MAG: DegT/DnrJ/EryC1/StrS family aminotransferase [Pseudomonadota bacterium]
MPKGLSLIHPDIDRAAIAAVGSLLARDDLAAVAFQPMAGGAIERFVREFLAFITGGCNPDSPVLKRAARAFGQGSLPLSAAGIGSATGAIAASLSALDAAGGEVIATSLNYTGVINAIVIAGAIPRFVDCDPANWCMDPSAAARAVTKKTKAIVLTHLNEFVDLAPFMDLLEKKGLDIPVIQDASLAVGSMRNGLRPGLVNIGTHGATVFSLTISKIITGMGGAIITSNDQGFVERVATIAHQGISLTSGNDLEEFGANYKMSAINAVIAAECLKRRETLFARRRKLKELYDEGLSRLVHKGKVVLQATDPGTVITHYGLLLPGRERLAPPLHQCHNIQTGQWHCHHMEGIYCGLPGKKAGKLAATERIAPDLTFLPFHTGLSDEDVGVICRALEEEINRL